MGSIIEVDFNKVSINKNNNRNLTEKSKNNCFEDLFSNKLSNKRIIDSDKKQAFSIRNYTKSNKQNEKVKLKSEEIENNIDEEEKKDFKFTNEEVEVSFLLGNVKDIIGYISSNLLKNADFSINNDFRDFVLKLEKFSKQNLINLKSDNEVISLINEIIKLTENYKGNKGDEIYPEFNKLFDRLNFLLVNLFNENKMDKHQDNYKLPIKEKDIIKLVEIQSPTDKVINIKEIDNSSLQVKSNLLEDKMKEEKIKENIFSKDKDIKMLVKNNYFDHSIKTSSSTKENELIFHSSNLDNEKAILRNIDKNLLMKQIIEKLNFKINKTNPEVKIKLKPEILGNLFMKITTKENLVIARIVVENYQVKQLIEANLNFLRDNLKEQGLEVYEFNVEVGQNTDFDNYNSQSGYSRNYLMNQYKRKLLGKRTEEELIYNNEIFTNLTTSNLDLKA